MSGNKKEPSQKKALGHVGPAVQTNLPSKRVGKKSGGYRDNVKKTN